MEDNGILSVISHCNQPTVKECIINDVKKVKKEKECRWDKRDEIGSGKHGKAYSVCCNNDCNYIVKVIQFKKKNKNEEIESFKKEANMQAKFHSHGMAPRVIVACYCNHEGVILMDKVQLLKDYLVKNPSVNRQDIKDKYLKAYRIMLEKGLIHDDTNPDNIALSLDGTKPMFIDFGLTKEQTLDKGEIEQILKEFKMSLDLVFTGKNAKVDEKPMPEEPRKKQAKSRINISRVPRRGNILESSDDEDSDSFSIPRRKFDTDDEEDEIKSLSVPRHKFETDDDDDDDESSDSFSIPRRRFDTSDDEEDGPPKRRLF